MKKIIKAISIFCKNVIRLIDQKIVVPITKLIVLITSKFSSSSRFIENWLTKKNTLLFISLFLAITLFIVIDQKILVFTDNTAEVLKNQPVDIIYNEEAYVVEGLPETVDITLIGSKTDLYIAKQSSSQKVTVDLSGLKPGTHKVNITYSQNAGNIEYMVNPSVATVIISQKVSETRTLSVDIINKDKLDSTLTIKSINYDTDKIVIKGSEKTLKKVATVKALINVNDIVSQQVGTTTVKDVPLIAYDENGDVVDVEIVPQKIDVELEIASPSKEVPIKVIPKGEVSFGLAISSMNVSETKVTVYGDEETLASLTSIPVEIDVNGLQENKEYKVELSKPVGINSLSVNNVTVTVGLGEISSKDISGVGITPINLGDNYKAQSVSEAAATVTVNVKGVRNVIDNISSSDIKAYVDLSGLTEGEHEVDVLVEGNDSRVTYTSKTKKVKIIISKK
ncbi:MAG: CdaR family protein [Tenericutes bacterium]|nr:CdaR family protein [Mycoplasmatota bacterium]